MFSHSIILIQSEITAVFEKFQTVINSIFTFTTLFRTLLKSYTFFLDFDYPSFVTFAYLLTQCLVHVKHFFLKYKKLLYMVIISAIILTYVQVMVNYGSQIISCFASK